LLLLLLLLISRQLDAASAVNVSRSTTDAGSSTCSVNSSVTSPGILHRGRSPSTARTAATAACLSLVRTGCSMLRDTNLPPLLLLLLPVPLLLPLLLPV
jgi:hypothetical protein